MAKTAKKTRKRAAPAPPPRTTRRDSGEPGTGGASTGGASKLSGSAGAGAKSAGGKEPEAKGGGGKARSGGRPEPAGREPGTRPAFLRGLFAGAGAAMTLSMIVTMAAFAFTDAFAPADRQGAAAGAARPLAGAERPAGAIIEAKAEPTGKLALTVRATLTDRRYQPIKGARPTVTLDMVQMPQAHRTKPVALAPVAGSPGTYQAKLVAPMTGDFDVAVELTTPRRAEAHTRISLPAGAGAGS